MSLRKLASPDQDFEQGFFQLAYDKLQSKLFNLLPFLVGFEVVKKSDDGGKAVGVFGFKSENGQILYVPAFFINGKVKDLDTLYSRNNNQFYPLNEDFAELFLKDDITGLGGASDEKRPDIVKNVQSRNYRDVMRPPMTGRTTYASDNSEYKTLKEAGVPIPDGDYFIIPKLKEKNASVLDFISESSNNVKQAAWDLMEKYPGFTESLRRFYSDEKIAAALVMKEAVVAESDIIVVDANNVKEASSRARENFFKNGYAVMDKRADDKKSKFGRVQFVEKFTTPVDSGFYPYISEMGQIRHGLILLRPMQLKVGFNTEDSIVIDLDSPKDGQAYVVPTSSIFVKDMIRVDDYSSVHSKMEDPAEALPSFNNTYILINEALKVTQPFRIVENAKDNNAIRRLKVEPDYSMDSGPSTCCSPCGSERNVTLVFTKKGGDKLEHKGTMVYVPKGFKLLKIDTSTYYDTYVSWDSKDRDGDKKKKDDERSHIRQGKPGPVGALLGALADQNFFPMTVRSNGSEYFADIGGVKKKYESPIKAKIGFVTDLGLDEKNAAELVDAVVPNIPVSGYIKLAYTGEMTPPIQDEVPDTNELGQPTYYGQPWEAELPRDDGYQGQPMQRDLAQLGDIGGGGQQENPQQNVDNATQLAESGQKEIFDTQAIATLSRYSNPTDKVTSYVPNFVSSLDKLGRILFMIYWETEKFQDMYGKDELPELMELVKSVFKNLGDLIIFLKRKVPDLSINNNEQAMEQI